MVDRRCAITSVVRSGIRWFERVLHQPLGFVVERGRGLVEDQDRRVLQHRARDRDALALAAGQQRAVLADRRVHALRQAVDEFAGVGGVGRAAGSPPVGCGRCP